MEILEAGADDVGFVAVDDPAVAPQRADIDWLMPGTQTLISFVCRMNKENIRTPARSISNLEFHVQTDESNVVAQKIVSRLEARTRWTGFSQELPLRDAFRIPAWQVERTRRCVPFRVHRR